MTHDDSDTERDVEVEVYPTMDEKPARMDAVDSFFHEHRLAPSVYDGEGFLICPLVSLQSTDL